MSDDYGIKSGSERNYQLKRVELSQCLRSSPIPDNELLGNLGLYIERMHLSRIILMHDLYKRILPVPGVILEFGVSWGQNIVLFNTFRGMYEPYNYSRRVIGFDTFKGFPEVTIEDSIGIQAGVKAGDYGVSDGWKEELDILLNHHDKLSPLTHIKKWELVEGDASDTFSDYLDNHQELIVSLAYFDFDLYKPTKHCLEMLMPHLTKGSIVVFDELNCPEFPGETLAVQEVLGVSKIKLERDPNNPLVSWFEVF